MSWGTKKKPTKAGRYLVTLESGRGKRHVGIADMTEFPPGRFTWSVVAAGFGEIIAWRKMPEPFDGDMTFGEKMTRKLLS